MSVLDLGRTRLDTHRDRLRRQAAALLALVGLAAAVWVAAALAAFLTGGGFVWPQLELRSPVAGGNGGLLGLPRAGAPVEPTRTQFPVVLHWPEAPGWLITLGGAVLWVGWWRWVVRPLVAGLHRPVRHRGLARLPQIRRVLGEHAARAATRWTMPELPGWQRWLLAPEAAGAFLGEPINPRPRRRLRLWADWELRLRLVARSGWGKTSRLLVPLIRTLPGSAVVSSIEPGIFEQTVLARSRRRMRLRWAWLDLLARRWLPERDYPVACLDVSGDAAFTAGWPQVERNPITGCADFAVAYRRAGALVFGTNSDGDENDALFRPAAHDVLAAWLHAADLDDREISHLQEWLADTTDTIPRHILDTHPRADPSAAEALNAHLDQAAGRTTSGVVRYLTLAMASMTSREGQRICGRRFTDAGERRVQFDMAAFIRAGGTLYVLADPDRIERQRPLLSMLVNETFYDATAVAMHTRGHRLPLPHIAVFDELRDGVRCSDLPKIATTQRKYGVGYAYSVQSSGQEERLYGTSDAQTLRDQASATVIGGIDIASAAELSSRAGPTPVVTATRGAQLGDSEHVEHQDALNIADQQELGDGDAVLLGPGLKPFVAYVPSFREHRRTRRRIEAEVDRVGSAAAAARARARIYTDHSLEDDA